MGNLDENRNLNVNIEKKAINGIQRTGISCVAEAIGPCLNVFATRLYEMVTVSENSISLHGYFFGNIKAVTHFTD
jgi:hypothetical protein